MHIPVIDYYFWLSSDWSYLAHRRLLELAKTKGAQIRYKPIRIRDIFDKTGGIFLEERSQQRQDYRDAELKRWQVISKSEINFKPTHFPINNEKALRLLIGAQNSGLDIGDLTEAIMRAVWVEDLDISDGTTLIAIASQFQLSTQKVNLWMESTKLSEILTFNSTIATKAGVFSAPSYVLENEVFGGQDRLEQLSDKLADLVPAVVLAERTDNPKSKAQWKGELLGIYTAEQAGVEMESLDKATLVEGVGIEGDRYSTSKGYYSYKPHSDRQVTLIEVETLDALKRDHNIELLPEETRRNLLTRDVPLNQLVNRHFKIGEVELFGGRLNVPCKYLEDLLDKPVFTPLINRSGLNCRIVKGGIIRVNDPIIPLD